MMSSAGHEDHIAPELSVIEMGTSMVEDAIATDGVEASKRMGWLIMIRGGDVARTALVTEMTTENADNSVPMASHASKFASEFKIDTALQLRRETTDELLLAATHNGARTVLSDASRTREENEDKSMLPSPKGFTVMLLKNLMSAGSPANTRNVFEIHDIPLIVNWM